MRDYYKLLGRSCSGSLFCLGPNLPAKHEVENLGRFKAPRSGDSL